MVALSITAYANNGTAEVPQTYDAQAVKPMLLQWLERCDTVHQSCRDLRLSINDPCGPARLLYLGPSSASRVRLVPALDTNYKYAALSYIWGPEPHGAKTLKSNLVDRLNDIPVDSLPQVYRQALQLCRDLDIWYLWVDALCIIQPDADGDDQDWQEQSEMMGTIYANAYVTIAAAATASAKDKLFGAGRVIQNAPPSCRLFGDGAVLDPPLENPWLAPVDLSWVTMIKFSNLQSRGWCFQERLLSRRIIHLTHIEACWECHQSIATEHYPSGVPSTETTDGLMLDEYGCWRRLPHPNTSPTSLSEAQKLHLLKRLWPKVVSQYTKRALSMHIDILPAISAFAKVIHGATEAEYIAGFWSPVTVADLAWAGDVTHTLGYNDKIRHRPRDVCSLNVVKTAATDPSWSWSSVQGDMILFATKNPPAPEKERAKILEISAKPLFMSKPVRSAWLRVNQTDLAWTAENRSTQST